MNGKLKGLTFFILLAMILMCPVMMPCAYASSYEVASQQDIYKTVYLKNGTEIKGTVTEEDGMIKVVSVSGDVFYFSKEEIREIDDPTKAVMRQRMRDSLQLVKEQQLALKQQKKDSLQSVRMQKREFRRENRLSGYFLSLDFGSTLTPSSTKFSKMASAAIINGYRLCNRTEGVEMWSDAHFEALKAPMKMLADAGQKVITATLNKDPWNNQCFDPYADMITWTKLQDGKWSYDYKIFDKWVNFMMDLGINKMINCYSVVPWNNELHYFDQAGDSIVNVKADPGTEVFNDIWHHFFKDFKAHLTEKGWLEITNVAMDERSPKEMEATIKMLQKEAPELGISYADNQKSYKKYPFVKDISIEAGATIDPADLKDRQDRGLTTTYYVCCSDAFPNMFTFSGPAESVYAGWYALAMNFDGFLRWAYNSWVENPLTDSRFRTWPAGDTYIIYPGGRSSIRFERLIEGIQDLEKVKILRQELAKRTDSEAKTVLDNLNKTVAKFATIKPEKDYREMLKEAKAVVNTTTQFVYKK